MPVSSAIPTTERRAASRRRARWGWRRRWGLGALALGAPFASLPMDPALAQNLPQGGNIVGGAGNIQQTSSTQLTINQASQNLSIDWQSFSVGAGHIVRFNQPSSSATALNRVIGPDPSQIFGSIQANGRVVLMNPNGIYFGPSSMVDVNGLVATTARMSQADFLTGTLNFSLASNDPNARVVNEGAINIVQGGFAVLAAAAVQNKGTVVAQGGTVVLAGTPTFTVDFHGDGLLKFAATGLVTQAPNGAAALVENSGAIQANGGRVIMTARSARDVINNVINTTGIVEARSARVENGEIVIDGGSNGIVAVNGLVDASGNAPDAKGGNVTILGERVGLFENARVNVSGAAGGGQALVGGNYQGKGPEANAKMVYMDARAVIDASSSAGDGGRVILWSDEVTRNAGHINVSGARDGGFVEVSSKGHLDFRGTVNLRGLAGRPGELLLDPTDITITSAASSGDMSGASPFAGTNASSNLDVTVLNAALTGGTVTVTTASAGAGTGNIDITSAIINQAAGTTLILRADGAITIGTGGSIGSGGYLFNVALRAAGNITVGGSGISTSGGTITTESSGGGGQAGGNFTSTANINAGSGNITLAHAGTISIGGTLNTSGQVSIDAVGATTQTAAITGSGSLAVGGTGAVTLNHASNAFGNVTLSRTGATTNVSLVTSITPTMQTSALGGGSFSITGVGFGQAGAMTQDAGAGLVTIDGGSGTVTLNQANYFTDGLTISGGSITVGTAAQTFDNGSFRNVSFTQTGAAGTITLGLISAVVGGSINLTATAATQIKIDGNITTRGGDVTLYGNAPGGNPASGSSVGSHHGVWINGATVDAGGGFIDIAGRGGNASSNFGVYLVASTVVTSGTASVTMTGRGGTGGTSSLAGIVLQTGSFVQTQNGDITFTGIGAAGSSGDNFGIYMAGGSNVQKLGTGAGNVVFTGTGGDYANGNSIHFDNAGVTSAGTGTIALTGNVPVGSGSGINFFGGAVDIGGTTFQGDLILSADSIANSATTLDLRRQAGGGSISFASVTGGANIAFNGTGGGLNLTSGIVSAISNFSNINVGNAAGSGTLTVGAAYTAPTNTTLRLRAGDTVTIGNALTLSGTGSIEIESGKNVVISSNVTTATGDITILGNVSSWTGYTTNAPTFGSTTGNFKAVNITANVTSSGGNIAIAGKGGTTGNYTYGVEVASATVSTTGGGTLTIHGQGGTSNSHVTNIGAHIGLNLGTATISTAGGQLKLVGTGGGTGTTDNNVGIQVFDTTVSASGAGAIILTGTGGNGGSRGVVIDGSSAQVSATSGALTITGTGGSGYNLSSDSAAWASTGVQIQNSATVAGAGAVSITGTGGGAGTGTLVTGIEITSSSTVSATGSGGLTITGTGGNGSGTGNHGILVSTANVTSSGANALLLDGTAGVGTSPVGLSFAGTSVTIGGASHTGDTTLRADSISNTATTLTLSRQAGGGTITFRPDTDATTIGVAGGTGTLQIATGILGAVSGFENLVVGSSTQTGAIDIGAYTLGRGTTLLGDTAAISVSGAVALGINTLTLNTGGAIAQTAAITGASGELTLAGAGSGTATLTHASNGFGLLSLVRGSSSGNITASTVSNLLVGGNWGGGALIVTSTAGDIGNAVALASTGGALTLSGAAGIHVLANVTTNGGNIVLLGNAAWAGAPAGTPTFGSTTGNFAGVTIDSAATVNAGAGQIAIAGKGGNDAGGSQFGVLVQGGAQVSATGAIKIYGQGGNNAGNNNNGILISGAGVAVSAGGGGLTLDGTGGAGAGIENRGIYINGGASVAGSNGGAMSIAGTSGVTSAVAIEIDDGTISAAGATTTLSFSATSTNATSISAANASSAISTAGGALSFAANGGVDIPSAVVTTGAGGTLAITLSSPEVVYMDNVANNIQGGTTITGSNWITFKNTATNRDLTATTATGNVALYAIDIQGSLSVTAGDGAISVNNAITMAAGKNVTLVSNGATTAGITFANNVTLANGTFTATSDRFITVGGGKTINSGGGNITMSANATGANGSLDFAGIFINGGIVESRGGHINLTGKGSASGGTIVGQHGIYLLGGGIVRSYTTAGDGTNGTVTLIGTGGTFAGGDNGGVVLVGGSSSVSARDGNITITATGGTGASGGNAGLYIGGGTIGTDGTGSIAATGTGGDGNASRGIAVTGNSGTFGRIETTGGGDITLTGTGGTTNGNNVGVFVFGGASNHGVIRATAATGNISITGTGGAATATDNVGIAVQDANSTISTVNGTLTLNGTGGGGASARGVAVIQNAVVETTGTGNLSVTGAGGGSGNNSYGVHVAILSGSSAAIRATGAGTVTLTGTGGTGSYTDNHGIVVEYIGAAVRSTSGLLTLTGTGGTGGTGSYGSYIGDGATVETTAAGGDISVTGTGGTGGGIWLRSNVGTVTIGNATMLGSISLIADTIAFTNTTNILASGTSSVTFRPNTASTTIGIGTGTGTLQLPADMSFVDAGTLQIGSANAGAIDVGASGLTANANANLYLRGDSMSLNGNVTLDPGKTLTLHTLSYGVSQSAASAVTTGNLILRGGGTFTLDAGGSGFNTIEHVAANVTNGGGTGSITLRTTHGSNLSEAASASDTTGTVNGITASGNLTWVGAGGLAQTAAGALSIGGTTSLTANAGGINFNLSSANNFGGEVALNSTSGGAFLANTAATSLGNVTGGGAITISSSGALSQATGTTINQTGTGTVSLSSTTGGVALRGITTVGDLTVSAGGGSVTQAGAGLNVGGNADITSVGGNIALNGASNSATGTISLAASGGNVDWSQASGNAVFGAVTAGGTLTIDVTGGMVSQVGAFNVTGTSSINAASASLTNVSNAFGGALSINVGTGAASVTVANNLVLGNITAGDFTATVPGNLTQTGVLSISGLGTTLTVDGTTTLTNASNNFGLFLDLLGTGTGALDGTVGGLSNAAALPYVTATNAGYTFGGAAVPAASTALPPGFDPFAGLPADFLTFLNTFLTSLSLDASGPGGIGGGFDGGFEGGPGGPVFSPANILAFLAEPGPGGGPGGGPGPGPGPGNDPANTPPTGGAPQAGAGPVGPLPPAGTFAVGQTIVVRTASGAQPVTVQAPVGAATPQVILRGLLNAVAPPVPAASGGSLVPPAMQNGLF